ncbi:T6SS immunity protein Tdi1 domain-containing protein [Nocardia sp. NPDC050710]|uniref:T6SS immunity protein Tdi1 domain-containing protein n=1 Tax=Nocardia sp. NPDC050710 TaxID=3157220 RepID=UPI0034048E6C
MELVKPFTAQQFEQGLASWAWIGLDGKTPLCASLFGDVFFEAEDGLWWLDSLNGELTRPWDDPDALEAELNTHDGMEQYLLASLALDAAENGLVPGEGAVYDFAHPPILGGELSVENLQILDFAVSLNVSGQMHQQVGALPPGAEVRVNIE